MSKWTSEQLAWKIRRHGVEMTHLSGGSHIGAIMSVADIVAVLYADVMSLKRIIRMAVAFQDMYLITFQALIFQRDR